MYIWTACFIFIDIFNKMNNVNRFFFLILLFLSSTSFAQTIEDRLTIWSTDNAIEKLYLHLDRDSYFSGQA